MSNHNRGVISMRRLFIVLLAAVGLIAATVVPAVPAAGQEDDNPLTINPDVGHPGDLVAAHVDPETVADNCMTTIEEVQDLTMAGGDLFFDLVNRGPLVGLTDDPGDWIGFLFGAIEPEHTQETLGVVLTAFGLAEGVAQDDELAAQFLAELFVLTFVDIATQEPVGETSNFDPNTGHGTIVVPDLDPGLWAIAATCVEPVVTDESFLAMAAAAAAALDENFGPYPDSHLAIAEGGDLEGPIGLVAPAGIAALMEPQEGGGPWVQPFSIPGPGAEVDPAVEAFCAVLPELSPLGDEVTAALAGLPEDDGEMTDEEWAESEDWDAIEAELRELFATANELMAIGDETRADAVAPQWEIVTAPLRQATEALEAVDYDLSTPSGRQITGELREGATAENGDGNGESAAATEVLTQWFLDNCIPAAPPAPEAPGEETPREAPPAPIAVAQPTFTG